MRHPVRTGVGSESGRALRWRGPSSRWRGRAATLLCGLATLGAGAAGAEEFPTRPVRLIVTQAAGGAPDLIARLTAERLTHGLGQSVIVENRPGGANVVGAQAVAHAPADGYTLLFATAAALVTNPYTLKSLPYDPTKDFTPVGMVGKNPFLVAVNAAVPAHSLADVIAMDHKDPGRLAFATDGPRNFSGMIAAWLNKVAGTRLTIVSYAAMPQGIQDTVAGRTQLTILAPAVAGPMIKRGDLRVLAQTGARRMPGYEEVPTVAETFPGFEFAGWFALVAPAGTPGDAIRRLNRELDVALKDPVLQERMRSLSFFSDGALTPEATGQFIRAELERWGRVVQDIGLQPE